MNISQHPQTNAKTGSPDQNKAATRRSGDIGAYLLAAAAVAALATAFSVAGVPGLTLTMVALVPVILVSLVLISVGK